MRVAHYPGPGLKNGWYSYWKPYKLPFQRKNQIQNRSSGFRVIAQKRYRFYAKSAEDYIQNRLCWRYSLSSCPETFRKHGSSIYACKSSAKTYLTICLIEYFHDLMQNWSPQQNGALTSLISAACRMLISIRNNDCCFSLEQWIGQSQDWFFSCFTSQNFFLARPFGCEYVMKIVNGAVELAIDASIKSTMTNLLSSE